GHVVPGPVGAIHEVHVIVVAHERVAAFCDRTRAGLVTRAAGLRRVLLGLQLIREHALQRAHSLYARPDPLTRRRWHSLPAHAHAAMRPTGRAEHGEEALHA